MKVFSQLSIGTVDAGPYTPGSTIAATFTTSSSSCISPGNQFQLYLSDAAGDFGAERLIGTYNGFYSTYVNGIIPVGTPAGTGYKLRVKSTTPALISTASIPFEIKTGTPVEAKLSSNPINGTNAETFGSCTGKANSPILLTNESTATSTVTASVTDEISGGTTTLNFPPLIQTFTAQLAHYTIFTKAVMPDGTVATKAYLLINNKTITAFATSSNNIVCLPIGYLEFSVDVTSPDGIRDNFPGDVYTINWGDGSSSIYTFCDIKNNGGKVRHPYLTSSCGSTSNTSSGTVYNAFDVSIKVSNGFCGDVGTPVSSYARVIVKPVNEFVFNPNACTNTDVTFTNTSTQGENPNTNSSGCTPNLVTYNWFVDGVAVAANKPFSFNLVYKFTTHGEHIVRLESSNPGACDADPVEHKICVQDAPIPKFTFSQTTICAGSGLKPTDISVIDNICNGNNTYEWIVTPAVGYANGTNSSSKEPDFVFNNPGLYTIRLRITSGSCGVTSSDAEIIVVNAPAKATLSPDITLCNLATYDFNNTTSGPTKTTFDGTIQELPNTYTWTVSPAGAGTYEFVNGSTIHSKYPSIKFNDYDAYTITVMHQNNCSSITQTQVLTFTTAPIVNAGPDQSICFNDPSFTLSGSVTGATLTRTWIGGGGIFSPNRNDLNAVYTPTAAEKAAGSVTLRLRITTTLAPPCNQIDDDVILTIKPDISITSATNKSICTGKEVAYTATNNVAGSTFSWTATGSADATGFSPIGSGIINDVITNNNLTANATVTYVITPHHDGCDGTPFNLLVTVTPNPVVTATALNNTICNQTSSSITLSSNLSNTSYTYSSVVTGSITGNTNRTVASTGNQINDILINSGTTPATVTYTVNSFSENGCSGAPVSITITVLPAATIANAGVDESLCNVTSYNLKGNTPVVGTGKWTIVSAPTTITFDDDTQSNTAVNGLAAGNSYIFKWTIKDVNCSSSSDDVQITVSPLSVGGITSGDATVCAGSNSGNIPLAGQVGAIIRWERSIDNGLSWATITSTANPYVFTNLTITTQFRAVIMSGACAEAYSTVSTVTVNPASVIANAGPDQNLCSGSTITLNGNSPSPNTGLWTLVSGQPGVSITDPAAATTTVTGLVAGQTYTFRWTISGLAPCPPTFSETKVTYYPPLTNTISGPTSAVCTGQGITIAGDTPTGGTGSYTYQWQNSSDGIAWSDLTNETNKDLNLVAAGSAQYRRLIKSSICTSTSNVVQVTVLPGITVNNISANQNICVGGSINPITGSVPAGGNGNFSYQWQSSLNGIIWVNINGATALDYAPALPASTTFFRRLVSSGSCLGNISNEIKITINPHAKAEIIYVTDKSCAPFQLTASNISASPYPDRNGTYTWYADGVQIGTGIIFPGYTIANDNSTVVIKLVVTSSLGCNADEMSHTFTTRPIVTAAFTQSVTKGCGPLAVTFTNTSSSLTEATFQWSIDNVVISNAVNPGPITLQPDPAGKDKTYTIILEATTVCGVKTATSTVLVRPKAVSVFSPDKTTACSPALITFSNTSPGTGNTYSYDFGDGSPIVIVNDKNNVSHTYTTNVVKSYTVTMKAENECGSNESSYTITISPNTITPELVVNSNEKQGCAPHTVNFHNNTSGASSFTYTFINETTGEQSTAFSNKAPEIFVYTFTKAGKYTVRLDATNGCSNASTTESVTVLAQPNVDFEADRTIGCTGLVVKFKNNSRGTVDYVWDFGDGSPTSKEFEPQHIYTGSGINYSVSLTATNNLGCSKTVLKASFINIVAPPQAAFNVSPGNELSIPNYTFSFKDISIDAAGSWEWNFGDGTRSTLQNPVHTYNNVGTYNVTLKVLNKEGCSATTFQVVRIIGVPGSLNLPNSFMPASAKNELRTFKGKGRGISEWHMMVFNKWGQTLWETTKLDDGAPAEGWDGTYEGKEQPQGVYYWKIDLKFINGGDWKGVSLDASPPKKTGVIYLIR